LDKAHTCAPLAEAFQDYPDKDKQQDDGHGDEQRVLFDEVATTAAHRCGAYSRDRQSSDAHASMAVSYPLGRQQLALEKSSV
jgi:hypothetical protein